MEVKNRTDLYDKRSQGLNFKKRLIWFLEVLQLYKCCWDKHCINILHKENDLT